MLKLKPISSLLALLIVVFNFYFALSVKAVNSGDTDAPIFDPLPGSNPATIEVGQPYVDAGATASDNYDNFVDVVPDLSNVNINVIGNYSVTYTATDTSGNTAEITRAVNVVDITAPIFDPLPGSNPATIEVGQPYVDAGATASDNYDNFVDVVPDLSNVNINVIGNYSVTYTATDTSNNTATTTRTVNVVDTVAPVIALLGDSIVNIELGSIYNDAGATSTDNYDGDLTNNIATTSNVNTNVIGAYTVTYDVSDSSGNPAVQVVRTVNIVPVPTPPATISSSGGGGGGGGSYNPVPTSITSINSPMTILPSQEGTVTNNFGQQATVSVKVPVGAVSGQTTFKTQMSAANANQQPANTNGAFMVGDKVFNITASDTSNNAVRNFNGNLNISIQLPDMPADVSGVGVYWFDETAGQWILVPGAVVNPAIGTITFSVNHLTVFAVINGGGQAAIELAKEAKPKSNSNKKVLGEQKYADGTLLRGPNKKIYAVSGGKLVHVASLIELAKYKGQEILDVADADINAYNQNSDEAVVVLGVESYGEGALLRGTNKKIYVVSGGKLVHIASLKELAKYAGQKIADVDDETIANFGKSGVLGDRKYADGTLLRNSGKKIYVVINGKLKHIVNLQELAKYAGKEIIDVADDVIASF